MREAGGEDEAPALMYTLSHVTLPGVALTEDAGEPGSTAHEALEVHTEPAVPVATSEGLGQLVVQVETCEEAALFSVFIVLHTWCVYVYTWKHLPQSLLYVLRRTR